MLVGKRSAASVLRVVLGVFNGVLGFAAVVLALIVGALILSPQFGGTLDGWVAEAGGEEAGFVRAQALFYFAAMLSLIATIWIFSLLRRMLKAVNAGDAFEHANVGRLQGIGLGLAALEVTSWVVQAFRPRGAGEAFDLDVDARLWVAVLVVFILAEVFRQGARMRDDAQMTV